MRPLWTPIAAGVLAVALVGAPAAPASASHSGLFVVTYWSPGALPPALRASGAVLVRSVPSLRLAELRVAGVRVAALRRPPGIDSVRPVGPRAPAAEHAPARGAAAVDHGARILNLSVGGVTTSPAERRAIRYAVRHGVLVIAPVGNEHASGNPVEYPAALLQPVGSNGVGGSGLAVGASTSTGVRAPF